MNITMIYIENNYKRKNKTQKNMCFTILLEINYLFLYHLELRKEYLHVIYIFILLNNVNLLRKIHLKQIYY